MEKLKKSIGKSVKMISRTLPLLLGILLLITLLLVNVPKTMFTTIFTGNSIIDPTIGAIAGAIIAGSPINSYIIGGELLNGGIGLVTITAFIVAWVTVGFVQIPAETMLLGKKFTLVRNGLALIFSIIVAIITVTITQVII